MGIRRRRRERARSSRSSRRYASAAAASACSLAVRPETRRRRWWCESRIEGERSAFGLRRRLFGQQDLSQSELDGLIIHEDARALEEILRADAVREEIGEVGRRQVEFCSLHGALVVVYVEVVHLLVWAMVVEDLHGETVTGSSELGV